MANVRNGWRESTRNCNHAVKRAVMDVIAVGPATAITQNVVYGLPARAGRLHSIAAVEISDDNSTWTAATGANTVGLDTAAQFVRCTTGNTTVSFKVY